MNKNKRPHPAGDAAEQGKHGKSSETISNIHSTGDGADRQGRIFSLLLEGEENAIPAFDLARLAGYRNTRSLRAEIDRERDQDNNFLILASEAG